MMSLFSNFDLKFFNLVMTISLTILIPFMTNSYKLNMKNVLTSMVMLNLEKFFLSLKHKSFNKSFISFFCMIVFLLMFLNFTSVLPFNYPSTSQMSMMMFTSLTTWLSFLMFSNVWSMKGFISHCVPEGTPLYLVWFLFVIEIVSNMIRPITLTVRLMANILAGHLLMILLSQLAMKITVIIPFYSALNLIEMFVALIQAYIFSTMMTLYFSEVN